MPQSYADRHPSSEDRLRGCIVTDGARGAVVGGESPVVRPFPALLQRRFLLASMLARTIPKKSSNSRLTLVFESV